MKKLITVAFLLFNLMVARAQDYIIYQVSDWTSKTAKLNSEGFLTYSDDNITLIYDLWSEAKLIRFSVYNKTDKPITIDWTKSHFILQDNSFDFFSNNVSTFSSGLLQRSTYYNHSSAASTIKTTTTKEKEQTHVPPFSIVNESFYINSPLVFDCVNYLKKLKKQQVEKYDYNEANTPYKLRNYITYYTVENKTKTIDNDFYISMVQNMNKFTFLGDRKKEQICNEFGVKSFKETYSFPYYKPYRQYQIVTVPNGCCF